MPRPRHDPSASLRQHARIPAAWACVVAAVVLAAGCLGGPGAPEGASPDAALPPGPYDAAHGCPGGDDGCVHAFRHATDGYSEPFVATHPEDESIFAVGVHVRPRTFAGGSQEPTGLGMALLLTRDGGASFERHDVPFPPARLDGPSVRIMSDPTFAFAPDGSIDFVGIAIERRADLLPFTRGVAAPLEGTVALVFHTRFVDGAFTPPEWIVPEERHQDRPWLLRHPGTGVVYVTWQTEGADPSTTTWAWLDAEGWSVLDPALEPPCYSTGPLVASGDGVLVSCSDYEAGEVQIWSFVAGGVPARVGAVAISGDENTRSFLAAGGGRSYLVVEAFAGGVDRGLVSAQVYWNESGSWEGPIDLARSLGSQTAFVTWAIADADGRLHALVRATTPGSAGNVYALDHVVFAPLGGEPWSQTLDTWDDPPTRSLFTNTPDHDFESLALRPGGDVLLAWGRVTDGRQSADGVVWLVEAR